MGTRNLYLDGLRRHIRVLLPVEPYKLELGGAPRSPGALHALGIGGLHECTNHSLEGVKTDAGTSTTHQENSHSALKFPALAFL